MAHKDENDPRYAWSQDAKNGFAELSRRQHTGNPPGFYLGLYHRNCMNWAVHTGLIGDGERAGYDALPMHERIQNEAYCAYAWRFWEFQMQMAASDRDYDAKCRQQMREYDKTR